MNAVLTDRGKVLSVVEEIYSLCKIDKHAYLKHVCHHTMVVVKTASADDEEDVANWLFYPFQVAASTPNDPKRNFTILAVKGLHVLVVTRLVSGAMMYASPNLPLPAQKKGIFTVQDVTRPADLSSMPTAATSSPTFLVDRIISTLMPFIMTGIELYDDPHSAWEDIAQACLHTFASLMTPSYFQVHGNRLLACFDAAFYCSVQLRPFARNTHPSVKNVLPQVLTSLLRRSASRDLQRTVTDDVQCNESTPDKVKEMDQMSLQTGRRARSSDHTSWQAAVSNSSALGDASESSGAQVGEDCLKIFQRLCWSFDSTPATAVPEDAARKRLRRVHSLFLITHFLSSVPSPWSGDEHLAALIHTDLSPILLQGCISADSEVFDLALRTLALLVRGRSQFLKDKVIFFFLGAFMPLLESPRTSMKRKYVLLDFFDAVLGDTRLITTWFFNFDCVCDCANLLEQVVRRLSRLVPLLANISPGMAQQQAFRVQLKVYFALCKVLNCMYTLTESPGPDGKESGDVGDVEHASKSLTAASDDTTAAVLKKASSSTTDFPISMEKLDDGTAEAFEQLLRRKKSFMQIIHIFNEERNFAKSVGLAIDEGLLESSDPPSVARFLCYTELNPVAVGQFLSRNDSNTLAILSCFIAQFDFHNLPLDEAVRTFLSSFKMFGEAQTIDRTMELFANQYCQQNPDTFDDTAAAYVLSFSIVMLNTDAHSVHVKEKMTLDEFVRNNRGMNNGKDFPIDMLTQIYKRITEREIVLRWKPDCSAICHSKRDEVVSPTRFTDSQVPLVDHFECAEEALRAIAMDTSGEPFHTPLQTAAVGGAMFDSLWPVLSVTFYTALQKRMEHDLRGLCLKAFTYALHICASSSRHDTLKTTLARLFALTNLSSDRLISQQNAQVVALLVRFTSRNGNRLGCAWEEALQCISSLEQLREVAASTEPKRASVNSTTQLDYASSNHEDAAVDKRGGAQRGSLAPTVQAATPSPTCGAPMTGAVKRSSAAAVSSLHVIWDAVSPAEVERIFSKSNSALTDGGVVGFVTALCAVSTRELTERPPRLFALQKLIETVYLNSNRKLACLSTLWGCAAKHLCAASYHKSSHVAYHAVNGLRQLVVRLLSSTAEEMPAFHQSLMQPFVHVASRDDNAQVREFIVASLGQIIAACGDSIGSGWEPLFQALIVCCAPVQRVGAPSEAIAAVLEFATIHHVGTLSTSSCHFSCLIRAWGCVVRAHTDSPTANDTRVVAVWFTRLLLSVLFHSERSEAVVKVPLIDVPKGAPAQSPAASVTQRVSLGNDREAHEASRLDLSSRELSTVRAIREHAVFLQSAASQNVSPTSRDAEHEERRQQVGLRGCEGKRTVPFAVWLLVWFELASHAATSTSKPVEEAAFEALADAVHFFRPYFHPVKEWPVVVTHCVVEVVEARAAMYSKDESEESSGPLVMGEDNDVSVATTVPAEMPARSLTSHEDFFQGSLESFLSSEVEAVKTGQVQASTTFMQLLDTILLHVCCSPNNDIARAGFGAIRASLLTAPDVALSLPAALNQPSPEANGASLRAVVAERVLRAFRVEFTPLYDMWKRPAMHASMVSAQRTRALIATAVHFVKLLIIMLESCNTSSNKATHCESGGLCGTMAAPEQPSGLLYEFSTVRFPIIECLHDVSTAAAAIAAGISVELHAELKGQACLGSLQNLLIDLQMSIDHAFILSERHLLELHADLNEDPNMHHAITRMCTCLDALWSLRCRQFTCLRTMTTSLSPPTRQRAVSASRTAILLFLDVLLGSDDSRLRERFPLHVPMLCELIKCADEALSPKLGTLFLKCWSLRRADS